MYVLDSTQITGLGERLQAELEGLYPAERPMARSKDIALVELPVVQGRPTGSLVKSIRKFGVIEPVVLGDNGDDGYVVIDGRRRIAAAREAKLSTVPARIYDNDDIGTYAPVLTVMANEERSSNPASNFDAVYDLAFNRRVPEPIIARVTGLTVPTVKSLLSLTAVPAEILDAMRDGKVRFSVVRMIAKLTRETQTKLVATLAESGTITAQNVRAVTPPTQEHDTTFESIWRDELKASLSHFIETAPLNADTEPLRLALAAVDGASCLAAA
jgi:ParB/RepB/Spo0J family partition protein